MHASLPVAGNSAALQQAASALSVWSVDSIASNIGSSCSAVEVGKVP